MIIFRKKTTGCRASSFTLVELLAALAVFSIIMLLLMRFTNAANTTWTKSAANMRVYQNARAVMDLIGQDLRGIVLSSVDGEEIEIYDHAGTDDKQLTFVSAVGEDDNDASELVEITYQLDGTTLKRSEVGDNDGANWNFLGNPPGWESGGESFEEITSGVTDFSMDVYPDTITPRYVMVSLTLIDDRAKVTELQEQSKRTFTKTIFLSQ